MNFYRRNNESGKCIMFFSAENPIKTDEFIEEISEETYEQLVRQSAEKRDYTAKLYRGKIAENDIPEIYRDFVVATVKDNIARDNAIKNEIDDSEALNIIIGGDIE